MGKLANSIIGEYLADGYVEALIQRGNAVDPGLRVCIRIQVGADSFGSDQPCGYLFAPAIRGHGKRRGSGNENRG